MLTLQHLDVVNELLHRGLVQPIIDATKMTLLVDQHKVLGVQKLIG